ncbi:hypothetical protein HAHE_03490 [Haloferula helveola]|uniref:Thiol:disulfide interchange protein DsbD N-terminal domain-containing protein n=1 Tax=Haloferula helveola TaxID=490095 RepID=A0ABN6GYS7_9BACT|nr:hypothetical protein HAHE_03490 [Haloferula helveola]
MKTQTIGAGLLAIGSAFAGVRSGHAEAELIQTSEGYQAGKPVEVGIRLKLDDGWHTYWRNPGEGGMALSVDWKLPDGWVAGPLLHPVPVRFMTGELPGYGYEKEVVIPVFMTAGASAKGRAEVTAELSWLTCDDSACVPGDASLSISFEHENKGPGPGAGVIAKALEKVPQPVAGSRLSVDVDKDSLRLHVALPKGVDPTGCEVFPATPATVDHSKPIRLEEVEGGWEATVPANEYATGAPEELELVLSGGRLEKPLLLRWTAE